MRSRFVLVASSLVGICLPITRAARAEDEPERTPPSLSSPAPSSAAPAPSSPAPAPARAVPILRAEVTAGIGTPVGWLGAEALVAPIELLTLHGGAGLGSQGVQFTAGSRFRVHTFPDASRVALGAAWSTGAYAGVPTSTWPMPEMGTAHPRVFYWDQAHFVNGDVSLEMRAIRTFMGLGFVVNPHDARYAAGNVCGYGRPCSRATAELVPYIGLSGAFAIL